MPVLNTFRFYLLVRTDCSMTVLDYRWPCLLDLALWLTASNFLDRMKCSMAQEPRVSVAKEYRGLEYYRTGVGENEWLDHLVRCVPNRTKKNKYFNINLYYCVHRWYKERWRWNSRLYKSVGLFLQLVKRVLDTVRWNGGLFRICHHWAVWHEELRRDRATRCKVVVVCI